MKNKTENFVQVGKPQKKVPGILFYTKGFTGGYLKRSDDLPKSYQKGRKDFKQDLIKKIEGMKSKGNTTIDSGLKNPSFPYAQRYYFDAYNQALEDIIKLLEE